MPMEEKYQEVVDAFRNPTKMKIITLLLNNKKMTVTEMSRYIKTTRSNLYQVISTLVSIGMVKEPEVRPKKNYVEKYYSLNDDYFAFHDENLEDKLVDLSDNDFREILSSFLMAQSFNLEIIASSVETLPTSEISKLKKKWNFQIMSYGTCSSETSKNLSPIIKNELKKVSNDGCEPDTMFLFLTLPLFFKGFRGKTTIKKG